MTINRNIIAYISLNLIYTTLIIITWFILLWKLKISNINILYRRTYRGNCFSKFPSKYYSACASSIREELLCLDSFNDTCRVQNDMVTIHCRFRMSKTSFIHSEDSAAPSNKLAEFCCNTVTPREITSRVAKYFIIFNSWPKVKRLQETWRRN